MIPKTLKYIKSKDLGFVVASLLVHVDVFPRQELLVAEKALVKKSRCWEITTRVMSLQRRELVVVVEQHGGLVNYLWMILLANPTITTTNSTTITTTTTTTTTLLCFQYYTKSHHYYDIILIISFSISMCVYFLYVEELWCGSNGKGLVDKILSK